MSTQGQQGHGSNAGPVGNATTMTTPTTSVSSGLGSASNPNIPALTPIANNVNTPQASVRIPSLTAHHSFIAPLALGPLTDAVAEALEEDGLPATPSPTNTGRSHISSSSSSRARASPLPMPLPPTMHSQLGASVLSATIATAAMLGSATPSSGLPPLAMRTGSGAEPHIPPSPASVFTPVRVGSVPVQTSQLSHHRFASLVDEDGSGNALRHAGVGTPASAVTSLIQRSEGMPPNERPDVTTVQAIGEEAGPATAGGIATPSVGPTTARGARSLSAAESPQLTGLKTRLNSDVPVPSSSSRSILDSETEGQTSHPTTLDASAASKDPSYIASQPESTVIPSSSTEPEGAALSSSSTSSQEAVATVATDSADDENLTTEQKRRRIPLIHDTVAKMDPFVSTSTSAAGVDEDWVIPEFARSTTLRRETTSGSRTKSGQSQSSASTPNSSGCFTLPLSPRTNRTGEGTLDHGASDTHANVGNEVSQLCLSSAQSVQKTDWSTSERISDSSKPPLDPFRVRQAIGGLHKLSLERSGSNAIQSPQQTNAKLRLAGQRDARCLRCGSLLHFPTISEHDVANAYAYEGVGENDPNTQPSSASKQRDIGNASPSRNVRQTVDRLVAVGGVAAMAHQQHQHQLKQFQHYQQMQGIPPSNYSHRVWANRPVMHRYTHHTIHGTPLEVPAASPTATDEGQLSHGKMGLLRSRAAVIEAQWNGSTAMNSASLSIRSETDLSPNGKPLQSAASYDHLTASPDLSAESGVQLQGLSQLSAQAITGSAESALPFTLPHTSTQTGSGIGDPSGGNFRTSGTVGLKDLFSSPLHTSGNSASKADVESNHYIGNAFAPPIQVASSVGSVSSGLSTALAETEEDEIMYPALAEFSCAGGVGLDVARQLTTPPATGMSRDGKLSPGHGDDMPELSGLERTSEVEKSGQVALPEPTVSFPDGSSGSPSTDAMDCVVRHHVNSNDFAYTSQGNDGVNAQKEEDNDDDDDDDDDDDFDANVEDDVGQLVVTGENLSSETQTNSTSRPCQGQAEESVPIGSNDLCTKCTGETDCQVSLASYSALIPPPPPHETAHHLVIAMVGLPARGKSYISKKLSRYLRWLRYDCRLFDMSAYRRAAYGSGLPLRKDDARDKMTPRERVTKRVLDDMGIFLINGGKIAIYDASNINRKRRALLRDYLRALGISFSLLWVESICTDDALVDANILDTKLFSPDYRDVDVDFAIKDFKERLEEYSRCYEPVSETELTPEVEGCVKLFDTGHRTQAVGIRGYLLTKIVFYLMNLQITKSPIYFSRHGESEANVCGQVGTDSALSKMGTQYAKVLAEWLRNQPELLARNKGLNIYCSTLQRTITTAEAVFKTLSPILPVKVIRWRALAEISAGIYDGMTYAEIEQADPAGYAERNRDKLNYKYPQGESYKDVIDRVERVIFELERSEAPVIVIAHQAVIRCLLGYFADKDINDIPHLSVPLHTVIKIQPHAYGVNEEFFPIYATSTSHKHA